MLCHSGTPTMITATITPQNAGSSILPLISHKVFFLSTYSLALQQQQRQPYSKYMPTLLLRSVTPVLCCIRDPPPSLSFCNRSSSSKGLLLLLLLFFFLTPSSALLLHISKTWTKENVCFRSPPRLLPWHGDDDDDMQGPPRLLVLQLPKRCERILVAILRKNRNYCLLSTLASRAREDRTCHPRSRAQRKLPGQRSCCSASGDSTQMERNFLDHACLHSSSIIDILQKTPQQDDDDQ